jgi:putative amide transporter protein
VLLGVVLLYVGAVLAVNGIWLIGQAQAAPAPVAVGTREDRAEVSASVGGRGVEPEPARAERSPLLIQGREVAVLNIFTGFVGVVIATILLVQGSGDLASVRGAGFILLFAFTYLWVAFNQFLDAGGHAFGWYCLFVAITAIPAGIYTLQNAGGNPALVWLGINWFAWALLWGVFWALLALDRPVARLAGWLAIIEGIATAWALGFAVLIGALAF